MTFETLRAHVLLWAHDRNLLQPHNNTTQMLKVVEEVGELASAMLKCDTAKIEDGIGDVLVTLIILAEQLDLSPIKCLESAYKEIRDRRGETANGTFVKSGC